MVNQRVVAARSLIGWSVVLGFLVATLSACWSDNGSATSSDSPASGPGTPVAIQPQATTVSVDDVELPGRLLFVQNGTIWLWQGNQGYPLAGDGQAWQPAWSPRGTQIAYVEKGESYSDIVLADAEGSRISRLTDNSSNFAPHSHERIYDSLWALYPTWSPDGSQIAVSTQYGPPVGVPAFEYNLSLYTIPSSGGGRNLLYADDQAHCAQTAYAPDGSVMVYTRTETNAEGQQQLYQLSLTTGVTTLIESLSASSYDPAFSPSGNWLAYASSDGDATDIWVVPTSALSNDSTTPQRLTELGTARTPVFSPDGQMLAFLAIPEGQNGFELWFAEITLDANGQLQAGTPRQVTQDMHLDADSGLSWAF